MRDARRWTVEIFVGEADGKTYAEAALCDDIGNRTRGQGHAQLSPGDPDVPEIGDEIAVSRALNDLSERLLRVATDDLRTTVDQRVHLHR